MDIVTLLLNYILKANYLVSIHDNLEKAGCCAHWHKKPDMGQKVKPKI